MVERLPPSLAPRTVAGLLASLCVALVLSSGTLRASTLGECEAAFAADPEGWNACACFYRLGRGELGREGARQRLEALLAADPARPCPHFYLASLAFAAGEDPSHHYRRAADLYAQRGQLKGAYYSHASLGRWLRGQGRFAAAVAALEAAASVARRLDDPRLSNSSTLEHLNLSLARGGDLATLEEGFEALHRRLDPDDWPELELAVADQLAQVRFRLGDLDAAQTMLDHQAERYRARGDAYAEATARYEAALCSLQELPRPAVQEEARRRLSEALEVAIAAGNLRTEVAVRRKLGELTGGEAGLAALRRSLTIARRLGEPDALYPTLLTLAERLADGHPEEAARLLAEADPGEGTTSLLASGWLPRLRTFWKLHEPGEALARSRAVLDEIEALRARQSVARAEYFSLWLPAHQWLAGTLLARAAGEPALTRDGADAVRALAVRDAEAFEQAFAVGERMRGRILLETVAPAAGAAAAQASPEEAQEARPELVELARVQGLLRPQEALLVFQLGLWRNFYDRFEGGAWLLVLRRDGESLYALPDAARLAPASSHYGGLFAARDGGEEAVGRVLFDLLLKRALEDLPQAVEDLVLVPDGALHGVPFAALPTAAGVPLGERYRLSRVPSATLWARWRQSPRRSFAHPALVMAAPTWQPAGDAALPGEEEGSRAPAADALLAVESPAGEGERDQGEIAARLGQELPGALREGRAIVRRLAGGSRLLTGEAATAESLATPDLDAFAVLHFATHALVDERRRQRSGVALAGRGREALLEPGEITDLALDGKVVVLAACRTGAGRVLYGEGPMSLARAFFAAGAEAVVATRWPLRDDESERFFGRFYGHLADGRSVAEALRRTQEELRRAGAPAAAWVGPMVLGHGAARPFPEALPRPWGRWLWLLSMLLPVVLWQVFRRRRRRSAP